MPNKRSYRLLCPIARALDRIGDRWTLLILRDLHAGPARFGELQSGLTGVASNLLASRLRQLQDDDLIRQRGQLYELTDRGEGTAPLLFELSQYGSQFGAGEDVRRPGNLRVVAVTLKEALRRAADASTSLSAELVVDGEPFAIVVDRGDVSVRYGAHPDAPVSIATDYEAMIATADGDLSMAEFAQGHLEVLRGSDENLQAYIGLMGRAFAEP
jgi:DNA-binding HxlR family transcriptional regulator